jgi:hypothetical protein
VKEILATAAKNGLFPPLLERDGLGHISTATYDEDSKMEYKSKSFKKWIENYKLDPKKLPHRWLNFVHHWTLYKWTSPYEYHQLWYMWLDGKAPIHAVAKAGINLIAKYPQAIVGRTWAQFFTHLRRGRFFSEDGHFVNPKRLLPEVKAGELKDLNSNPRLGTLEAFPVLGEEFELESEPAATEAAPVVRRPQDPVDRTVVPYMKALGVSASGLRRSSKYWFQRQRRDDHQPRKDVVHELNQFRTEPVGLFCRCGERKHEVGVKCDPSVLEEQWCGYCGGGQPHSLRGCNAIVRRCRICKTRGHIPDEENCRQNGEALIVDRYLHFILYSDLNEMTAMQDRFPGYGFWPVKKPKEGEQLAGDHFSVQQEKVRRLGVRAYFASFSVDTTKTGHEDADRKKELHRERHRRSRAARGREAAQE